MQFIMGCRIDKIHKVPRFWLVANKIYKYMHSRYKKKKKGGILSNNNLQFEYLLAATILFHGPDIVYGLNAFNFFIGTN